jgi:hypothetical protein
MFTKSLIKQTMLGAMITVVTLGSCKKENSTEPPVAPRPLQLIKFTDGNDETSFTYHTDGSFKSITLKNDPVSTDENVTYEAKYAANKKIDELIGSNGTKLKLGYSNGMLTKMEALEGSKKIAETVYAYNGTTIKSVAISKVEDNQTLPFFRGEFTFNTAGNITSSKSFVYNPLSSQLENAGYVVNQFDNRINPFVSLHDVITVFWQATTKNNITRQEYFDKDGKAQEVIETVYTYNAQGYPVRGAIKETSPGEQPTTAVVTFTYK